MSLTPGRSRSPSPCSPPAVPFQSRRRRPASFATSPSGRVSRRCSRLENFENFYIVVAAYLTFVEF